MRHGWRWSCCAAALAAGLALPAPAPARNLNTELTGLLLDHPRIRSAAKTLEGSRKGVKQTAPAYFPAVSATVDTGHAIVDSPGERNADDG